jgi:hypothetical protein
MTDILAVLIQMRDGEVALECNRKFNELLDAVMATGGKGKISVTLDVKPSRMEMGGGVIEVEMTHKCSIDKPERTLGRSLFFVGDHGLTRDNPAQERMFNHQEVSNG